MNADANAIGTYIDQYPFKEKGDTWQDLAFYTSVKAPKGKKNFSSQTIQKRITEVIGIKLHVAAVKEDHLSCVKEERVQWYIGQLELRPHSVHWRKVI